MTWGRSITEQRERRAADRERNLASLLVKSPHVQRGVYASAGSYEPRPKTERKSDSSREALSHKGKLAALGCMACRRIHGAHAPGPVELHHLRTGGWGKGDYLTLIPLCVEHHRGASGVHGLGTKEFPKQYGFDQADLLADALQLLEDKP